MQDRNYFLRAPILQSLNIALGGPCWVIITVMGAWYMRQVQLAVRTRKRWCGSTGQCSSMQMARSSKGPDNHS